MISFSNEGGSFPQEKDVCAILCLSWKTSPENLPGGCKDESPLTHSNSALTFFWLHLSNPCKCEGTMHTYGHMAVPVFHPSEKLYTCFSQGPWETAPLEK